MKNPFLCKNSQILAVLICFLVIFPIILSNCDIFSDSVDEFIDFSTGTADIIDITVTSIGEEKLITRSQTWIHDPSNNFSPGILTFEIKINNPKNYDLEITPVIYEFIGDDWKKTSSPPNRPVSVSAVKGKPDSRKIQIGNNDKGNQVKQGDSFRIRLDLATKDGTRNFKSFTDIPQIIYDSRLKPATGFEVEKIDLGANPNSSYGSVVSWYIQGDDEHKGINRTSITFSSKADASITKTLEYALDKSDSIWKLQNGTKDDKENYGVLKYSLAKNEDTNHNTKFSLSFPFLKTDGANFNDDFVVIIDIKDKNNQSSTAGKDANPATYLDDISIWYQYRSVGEDLGKKDENSDYYDSGWKFTNKNMISETLVVPNNVIRVKFIAVKSKEKGEDDVPYGNNQEVHWGSISKDEPTKTFPLTSGQEKSINMEVHWKSPYGFVDEEPDPMQYNFIIYRLGPNEDATLKGLEIQDATGSYPSYSSFIYGGFNAPTEKNIADGSLKTHYTVNVPGNVNKIRILGNYLSTSEIYNGKNQPLVGQITDNPNTSSSVPYPPYLNLKSKVDYKTYYDPYNLNGAKLYPNNNDFPLYIIQNGWNYDIKKGINTFDFYVRSESESYDAIVRCYTIEVIRTDESANPNAKINNLLISYGSNPAIFLMQNSSSNDIPYLFNSDTTDYTVEVPSSITTDLTVAVTPRSGAKISEITYIDSTSGAVIRTFDYPPPNSNNITIPAGKSRLTYTVYSTDIDSTPRNYTINFVKRITYSSLLSSALAATELYGYNNILKVINTNTNLPSSGYSYELAYSLVSPAIIAEKSVKLQDSFTHSRFNSSNEPIIIGGLQNFVKYNVWVRAVNSTNIPGDWVPSTVSAVGIIGIPGPAELTGITPTIIPAPVPVRSLSPGFSPGITEYTLTIPSGTTSLSFTGATTSATQTAVSQSSYVLPGKGEHNTYTITANSPDGKTSKPYYITVIMELDAPNNLEVVSAIDGEVKLSWTEITGANYEVYYSNRPTLNDTSSDADVVALADKWSLISGTTATISPLTNASEYRFWVRGIKEKDIPGAFAMIKAIPKSPSKILTKVDVNTASYVITPKFNSIEDDSEENYTIALPASSSTPGNTIITITKQNEYQKTEPSSGENKTFTINYGTLANGTKDVKSVVVTSHSDIDEPIKVTKTYNFTIYRKLAPPGKTSPLFTLTELSNSIFVDGWNTVTGATGYEIFCGKNNNINYAEKWAGTEINISSTKGTAKVLGLQNDTDYYLWVRAYKIDDGIFIPGEFLLLNTNDTTPLTPNNGKPKITVSFSGFPPSDLEAELKEVSNYSTVSWKANTELKIEVIDSNGVLLSSAYDYKWYIDGVPDSTRNGVRSTSFYAGDFTVAKHNIAVRITPTGGKVYSKTLDFEVID